MLKLQNIILEMIARGDTLVNTATRICIEAEGVVPDVICSVLTVDGTGIIHPLAGPSLPSRYSLALDGLKPSPTAGSCGTAVYLRSEVTVTDIESDSRWADYKHLALPLGLRACWSSPILDATGEPVGTFAFYYRECRGPTELEREIVRQCVHLRAIAFERERRMEAHQLRAFTDALTGLPNRAAFNAALGAPDCGAPGDWALLLIDLDNLKVTNDTFGHFAGDCLLKIAGERIAAAVAPNSTFRIGGDEFAAVLQSPASLEDLEGTAEQILAALAGPAECGEHVIIPRATIGGASLSLGDRVAERVRQNADFALYHAKETSRGGFVRYWPGLGTNITRRLGETRDRP